MSHLLVLVTDGTRGLFVKDKLWTLPDTNIWYPLEWPKKDCKRTTQKLVWLVTYGLLNLKTMDHTVCVDQVFSSSETHKAIFVTIEETVFTKLISDLESVTKYMKYAKKEIYQFQSFVLKTVETNKAINIPTIHCVRTFLNK